MAAAGLGQLLQQSEADLEAIQVLSRIEVLARDRIPSEMNAGLGLPRGQRATRCVAIAQVDLEQFERLNLFQPPPRAAGPDERPDLVTVGHQPPDHAGPDESGGAGYQDAHWATDSSEPSRRECRY